MRHVILATTTIFAPATSSAFLATQPRIARFAKNPIQAPPLLMSDPNYNYNQDPNNNYNQDPNYNYDEEGQQYYQQEEQEEQPSLFVSGNMQEELSKATADFSAPIDFLALARQRAAEKRESVNSSSSDDDWKQLAEEKRIAMGGYVNDDEGWEASLEDEGNEADVVGLGMGVGLKEAEGGVMVTESGLVVENAGTEDGEEGDEPKLLLF